MKNTILKTIGLSSVLVASAANAAIIDFASVADGDVNTEYYGVLGGERGAESFTFTAPGSPSVTAVGLVFGGPGSSPALVSAYLDSGDAGLGVCQVLDSGSQCAPSSDDNVTYREMLSLTFDEEVTLNDVDFVNGLHGTDFSGQFELTVDDVFIDSYSLTSKFTVGITGKTFWFYNPNGGGGSDVSNNQQLYINTISFTEQSAVPIPAAVWLFGSGLLGLVGVARRKA